MGLTVEARNKILNHFYRNEVYTPSSTVYLALFTDDGEIEGKGYTRQSITFGNPDNGTIENDEEVGFPIATEDWGDITQTGVFDAEEGGMRMDESTGEEGLVATVKKNQKLSFPVGNCSITIKGEQMKVKSAGVVDEI